MPKKSQNKIPYRTAKISIALTQKQRRQVRSLMDCERWLYNEAIAALRLLNQPVYLIGDGGPVRACSVGDRKARKRFEQTGALCDGFPVREWREWKSFSAERYLVASESTRGLCYYIPNRYRFDDTKSRYGVSSSSLTALSEAIKGTIKGFFTSRSHGDFRAKLPAQFRSHDRPKGRIWTIKKEEIRWKHGRLRLGCKNQNGGYVTLKVPKEWYGRAVDAAKVTQDDRGDFWLHLSYEAQIKPLGLTGSAGIDMGQKRAVTIATDAGKSVTISGADIVRLKERRDRYTRRIQRLEARRFRGEVRHTLTAAEQQTMRDLEAKSSGAGTQYAHRMIAQRRRENAQRRRSRRQFKLLRSRRNLSVKIKRSLKYANHCITRKTADWLIDQGVGQVYVGEISSVPKGRKKGSRRIKQVRNNALWEAPAQIKQLEEKLKMVGGTLHHTAEHYTSQTCPNCGARHKPRNRRYNCRTCGWVGDRDSVGAANILAKSLSDGWPAQGRIVPHAPRSLAVSPAIAKQPRRKLERLGQRSPLLGRPESQGVDRLDGCDSLPRTPVRESVDVPADLAGESTRKPCSARNPAVKDAKEVRAIAETLTLFELPVAEAAHNDLSSKPKSSRRRRSAPTTPQRQAQLGLWDSAAKNG